MDEKRTAADIGSYIKVCDPEIVTRENWEAVRNSVLYLIEQCAHDGGEPATSRLYAVVQGFDALRTLDEINRDGVLGRAADRRARELSAVGFGRPVRATDAAAQDDAAGYSVIHS